MNIDLLCSVDLDTKIGLIINMIGSIVAKRVQNLAIYKFFFINCIIGAKKDGHDVLDVF